MTRVKASQLYALAWSLYDGIPGDSDLVGPARALFDAADKLAQYEALSSLGHLEAEHARPTLVPTPCDTEWP